MDRQRESHNPFSRTHGGGGSQLQVARNPHPGAAVSKDNNLYPQDEGGEMGKMSFQARRKSVAGKWLR